MPSPPRVEPRYGAGSGREADSAEAGSALRFSHCCVVVPGGWGFYGMSLHELIACCKRHGIQPRCPRCFDGLGEGGETTPALTVMLDPQEDREYFGEALMASGRHYLIPARAEEVPE